MSGKTPRILYLHGFASSLASRKAHFFAEKLNAEGLALDALDLAPGSFTDLTLTSQLSVVENAANGEPVILIGSSLGGYLAALYVARHPEVSRLILLAPAFRFAELWEEQLGPLKMAEWREKGTIPVFHYGEARQMDLGYRLIVDAQNYEAYPAFTCPCLIFHGTRDSVVPIKVSEVLARARLNVRLVTFDSGHELTDMLDEIWKESKPLLVDRTSECVGRPIGCED